MSNRLKSRLSYSVVAVAFVAAVALVAHFGLQWPSASVKAAEEKTAAPAEELVVQSEKAYKHTIAVGETSLPLKRVVLFSSGVGYFAHAGQVQDNAKVELKFKLKDINDLLKSMVVQDYGGGHVSTVGYGSNDPLEKRLSSFAIDLNGNPRLAALLGQVRGERVEVEAPNKIVGTIVGLEIRKVEVGKDHFIESDVLNLLCDEGLRSVPLESASHIKLLNEKLDGELHKALAALASTHATDKKTVTLDFRGLGTRKVSVSYVEETPVWKTSYRLVLGEKESPFLQGWAIVENPTEEDWNNVRLTLVSGRPISFVMDLYQPIYIPRPVEMLELYSSLRPQSYDQDMERSNKEFLAKAEGRRGEQALGHRKAMLGSAGGTGGFGGRGSAAASELADEPFSADLTASISRQGVQSVATAGKVGELFQYVIATPVTLSRHESAMLPIINSDVKTEKVSIYNPAVQFKHPLAGVRLTNTTKLHLMQGPITVFDGGAYAGDAKIDDIPPGSERLLSYALDLDTEVALEGAVSPPAELLSVRIVKGVLVAKRKSTQTQNYTVKNSGEKTKKVLIEQGYDPAWTLITPKKPEEKTRDRYRFAVEAKPGVPVHLKVEQERVQDQQFALSNLDDGSILFYIHAKEVSPEIKKALAEVIKRKQAIQEVTAKLGQIEQQIRMIGYEQNRIRDNMGRLDHGTDLYKRYVKKFSDQEDEIERLHGQTKELTAQETQLRRALDDYLVGLEMS